MKFNHFKSTKDLPEYYRKQAEEQLEKINNRNPCAVANKKRTVRNESMASETFTRFNRPVSIIYDTARRRETDNRALEDKYFTDSLVTCGVLQDDKKKYVARLEVPEPNIGTDEKTIIRIEEINT
jgi:hypothetical protein